MTIEETVKKMNHALNSADFNKENFNSLLGSLIEKENVKLKLLDFGYYNEERLEVAVSEKQAGIKSKKYEWAATWRKLEREILEHIELREKYDVKWSEFHYDREFLIYLYFGKGKNVEEIKDIIRERIHRQRDAQ